MLTPAEYEKTRQVEIAWMENDERPLLRELYSQMKICQLKPLTVVDYEREVFTYPHGNVRITFDSSVRTSFRNNDLLNPDLPMVKTLGPDFVILKVKFDEYLPGILKKLLQIGDRRLDTYSKYHLSRMYG